MTTQFQQVLQTALALPETMRAEIAASLISSLDEQTDEAADAAWDSEIKRRLESIDRGVVQLVPWDDVTQELRGRRNE